MLRFAHINQDLQTESATAVLSSDIKMFDVGEKNKNAGKY